MSATQSRRSPVRWLVVAALMAAIGGLLWRYPLVRIRRLSDAAAVAAFDPRAFAERFWADDLTPALATAGDAGVTLAAIRRDGAEACRSLGRSVGLSRTCLYLVRGAGTIVDVETTGCRVSLGSRRVSCSARRSATSPAPSIQPPDPIPANSRRPRPRSTGSCRTASSPRSGTPRGRAGGLSSSPAARCRARFRPTSRGSSSPSA